MTVGMAIEECTDRIATAIWDYCESVDWGRSKAMMAQLEMHQIIAENLRPFVAALMGQAHEACAQLLDKQAAGFQVLIDHAPTPIRAEDLKRVKHSIEVCAVEMRKLKEVK